MVSLRSINLETSDYYAFPLYIQHFEPSSCKVKPATRAEANESNRPLYFELKWGGAMGVCHIICCKLCSLCLCLLRTLMYSCPVLSRTILLHHEGGVSLFDNLHRVAAVPYDVELWFWAHAWWVVVVGGGW